MKNFIYKKIAYLNFYKIKIIVFANATFIVEDSKNLFLVITYN